LTGFSFLFLPNELKILRTVGRRAVLILTSCCVCLALLVVAGGDSAAEIDWTLSAKISAKPSKVTLSPAEKGAAYDLWSDILVSKYGITPNFVSALYERRYDYGEIAMLVELAQAAHKDPADVAALRRRGLGWGALAKQLGVHPSSIARAKGNDVLFRRYVLADCLGSYYGVPDNSVLILLNEKKYDFGEIVLAVNVCAQTGVPLRQVVAARQGGTKWRHVAEKFKLPAGKLGTPPARPVPSGGKQSEDPKAKAKKK
jgi:hypothetical protein